MIDKRILRLTPKRILCPLCGEWHDWEGKTLQSYDEANSYEYECNNVIVYIWVDEDHIRIYADLPCDKLNSEIDVDADLRDMEYDGTDPVIKIPFSLEADEIICESECKDCEYCDCCNFATIGDNRDDDEDEYNFELEFKFEFASRYFNKYSEAAREEKLRQQREAEEAQRQEELARQTKSQTTNQVKEERKMAEAAKKGTSIKTLLYERSPKENMSMLKNWAEKYKPVLKWAVPVAAVYGAYRILNSDEFDLSVNNVAETCEKNLGFKMECLENKKALKELMVLGGLSAGAYGAVQALSGLLGVNNEKKEISADVSVEEVETGMNQLQSISKKFSWLQPKTENMLPIALSVIMVYVTLHKPKFTGKLAKKVQVLTEDMQIRVGLYLHLAKDFIQDKFNIDLSDEEEQRKLKICAFLLALMGILAFLYGKKVLGDKSESEADDKKQKKEINKSVEAFVAQAKTVVEKLAPAIYTYLITLLASKKILMLEEAQDVLEEEGAGDVVMEPEGGHQSEPEEGIVEQAETEDISEQQT